MAVPPSAVRPDKRERGPARGRWSAAGARARLSLNATAPTRSSSGASSRKRSAAERAASSRSGATSVAVIEREVSVTSTTEACSTGTATVVSGRASAITRPATESASRALGTWRRQRAAAGAARAATEAPGKRMAYRRRRRWASRCRATPAGTASRPSRKSGAAKLIRRPRARLAVGARRGVAPPAVEPTAQLAQPVVARVEHDVVGAGGAQAGRHRLAALGLERGVALAHARA